jgi:hypothetical protein
VRAVRTLSIAPASATIATGTGHVIAAPAPAHTITLNLTTSSRPETLHWLLDGTSQEPISMGGDLAWSFDWKLGDPSVATSVVDGTYVVAAEAFDAYGVAGPSRSLTVMVNRMLPDKVTGLVGGRSGGPVVPNQFVDLEWLPSRARDIIGYSVERVSSTGTQQVCARAAVTRCIDPDPPEEAGLRYRVYAWDASHVDGQPRKAVVPSDDLVINLDNNPPLPPLTHTAQLQGDGSVKLNWTRPLLTEDPDAGDRIAFWRIYRDGTGTDDRYAVWDDPDSIAQFIDGNTGGIAHEYWVTSVDTRYAESTPVKAVWLP